MKKKFQKGFTLVELIVVMAIMGIIMAVIMSIIRPTAKVATRIESQYDDETVAFQVGKSIRDELSYATQVKIVAAKDGDPVPSASGDFYSAVYVIDNTYIRHMSRKAATGAVLRGTWDGATISDAQVVMQEPTYGEDTFKFSIEEFNNHFIEPEKEEAEESDDSNAKNKVAMVDPTHYYIVLSIKGYLTIPTEDGNAYEPDTKTEYRYNQEIEFVNINSRNFLQRGGNDNAADFNFDLDEDSLHEEYDKIYIFFRPTTDTSVGAGSATFNGSPEDESEAESGGSDPEDPPAPPAYCTVQFKAANATDTIDSITVEVGKTIDAPNNESNVENPKYLNDLSDTKNYYQFAGWWSTPNGPSDVNGRKLDSSVTATGSGMTFYAYYEVTPAVIVTYLDFDGNVYKKVKIKSGTPAVNIDDPPSPGGSLAFDSWDGTPKFGENLITDTTYKPKSSKPQGNIYVAFEDVFNGNINLTKPLNGTVVYNASGVNLGVSTGDTIVGENSTSVTEQVDMDENHKVRFKFNPDAEGSIITLSYSNGLTSDPIPVYHYGTTTPFSFKVTKTQIEQETMAIFVVCGDDGLYYADDNVLAKFVSNVRVHVLDGTTKTITAEGADKNIGIVKMNGTTYVSHNYTDPKELTVSDGSVISIRNDIKFRYGSSSFDVIRNTGSAQDLYIYTDYAGNTAITKDANVANETFTKVRFRFLEVPDPNEIVVGAGTKFYSFDADNRALAPRTLTGDFGVYTNKINTNDNNTVSIFNDATFKIEGNSQEIPNSGGELEVWYYGGKFYIGKDAEKDARAAKAAASGGGVTVTASKPTMTDQSGNPSGKNVLKYSITIKNESMDSINAFEYKCDLPDAVSKESQQMQYKTMSGKLSSTKGTGSGNYGNFISTTVSGDQKSLTIKLQNTLDWGEIHMENGDYCVINVEVYNYYPGFSSNHADDTWTVTKIS